MTIFRIGCLFVVPVIFRLTVGLNYNDLVEIQKSIQDNYPRILHIAGVKDENAHNAFYRMYDANMKNLFVDYTMNEPVYVVYNAIGPPFHQLGNKFGYYFAAMCYCQKNGLHFVAFSPFNLSAHDPDIEIVKKIPTVFLNPYPVKDYRKALNTTLSNIPKIDGYDYMRKESLVWEYASNISKIIEDFSHDIKTVLYGPVHSMSPRPVKSFSKIIDNAHKIHEETLPLLPDALIMFRCSDIFNIGSKFYGMYSFNIYPMIIPIDTKLIYVISEQLSYVYNTPNQGHICEIISNELISFLSNIYKNATVTLRRGFPMESFVQLTETPLVICAPSTFCHWPSFVHTPYWSSREVYVTVGQYPFNLALIPPHIHPIRYPKLFMLRVEKLLSDGTVNRTEVAYRMVEYLKNPSPRKSTIPESFFKNFD